MRAQALGEEVTHLPWLAPCAGSLVALARFSSATGLWAELRHDPGLLVLLLRFAPAAAAGAPFAPSLLRRAELLAGALRYLEQPAAANWDQGPARVVYHGARRYAELASRLAVKTGRADPDWARIGGLLAPLGWLAVCAVAGEAAGHCLADPEFASQPSAVERRHWGLDQTGIGRRLVRRWQLPPWLGAIVGHLSLPADSAVQFGADQDLFAIVQLAVALAQKQEPALGLEVGATLPQLAQQLGLAVEDLEAVAQPVHLNGRAPPGPASGPARWTSPATLPLLRDLLTVAEERRRLADTPTLDQLESDLDRLHDALTEQRASETARLQGQKLGTLAEFAAGAGHEINNPLAVISGQAQYLLKRLQIADCRLQIADAAKSEQAPEICNLKSAICSSLNTIINQAQRIHDILTQLMQFARPPRPQKQLVDLGSLIRAAADSFGELAAQRQVRLVCPEPEPPVCLCADARQLGTILACLLRNAIEAAPAEGWAGIRVRSPAAERVEVLVEDSGSGPPPHQRDHLFDPFFSGRQAGRGRGLGLPTAWRLAQQHGGAVYLDDHAEGLTRFVLRLPREPENPTATNGEALPPAAA